MKRPFLIAMLFASFSVVAAEPAIEYQCPKRVMTIQSLATPLPGWRQSTERPFTTKDKKFSSYSEHNLDTVSFSEGVPEDRVTLIPDNELEATGKAWNARWDFAQSETIWMACLYRRTTVMLSQQLPPRIKRCFVRFDNKKGITVQRIWCQK